MINKDLLKKLYEKDLLSTRQIGKLYNVSHVSVNRWLKKYNISPINESRAYKARLSKNLNDEQKSFLIGTLLGDGHISVNASKKSGRFEVRHSIKQLAYVKFKHNILDTFASKITYGKARIKNKTYQTCGFKSFSHPYFLDLRDLFYIGKTKIVNKDIALYFNELSIAAWFMDDATLKSSNNIQFCTHSFTNQDHKVLIDLLKNYNINSRTIVVKEKGKNYNNLWLDVSNTKKICNLIRPFVIEEMQYKLTA